MTCVKKLKETIRRRNLLSLKLRQEARKTSHATTKVKQLRTKIKHLKLQVKQLKQQKRNFKTYYNKKYKDLLQTNLQSLPSGDLQKLKKTEKEVAQLQVERDELKEQLEEQATTYTNNERW